MPKSEKLGNIMLQLNDFSMPLIGIVMGSDSDLPIMKEACDILNYFKVSFEVKIVSAHRTPLYMIEYAQNAENRGVKVIIAGAGGSAHLPGMIASLTTLPVIGVPIKTPSNSIIGLDSLLSIVQMPPGVPVATVSINGAKNAGILACSILSIYSQELTTKIKQFKENLKEESKSKDNKLKETGYENYLLNKRP